MKGGGMGRRIVGWEEGDGDAGDGNWEAENVETIGESPWRRARRSSSKGSGVSGVQNRPSNRYRPLGAPVDGLLALFAAGRA